MGHTLCEIKVRKKVAVALPSARLDHWDLLKKILIKRATRQGTGNRDVFGHHFLLLVGLLLSDKGVLNATRAMVRPDS